MKFQNVIWTAIFVVAATIGIVSAYFALSSPPADASGWWQVTLGAFGIPILLYELIRLRQALEQKPILSIGLAGVENMPYSNIRLAKTLPTKIRVNRGYPHILLAIRNTGKANAKFVKVYLEFKHSTEPPLVLTTVKVYNWQDDDNRYSFKQESNVDFVFSGGADWVIHPNDTEIFSFHMSTTIVTQTEPFEMREYPPPGIYEFDCTVWAEGLNSPISERLIVEVVEKEKPA